MLINKADREFIENKYHRTDKPFNSLNRMAYHGIGYAEETGFSVAALDYSPVKGPEGNIEYLMMLKKDGSPKESFDTEALVERSHSLDIKGA